MCLMAAILATLLRTENHNVNVTPLDALTAKTVGFYWGKMAAANSMG